METLKYFTRRVFPSYGLKPFPTSAEEFLKEFDSFQHLDSFSEPPSRAKLFHFIMSSAKIQRPFESAMILLVGSSGVGKSATINHLLDTGGDAPVAKTSNSQAETRATSEYIITTDEPNYDVSDLQLSVIDTPGFNDNNGVDQDACNFFSIKNFFETHPSLPEHHTFPNLVFLVVSATDMRIKGRNSNLSKSLRSIKLLDVVDTERPNLVVVVTFCCSFSYENLEKWKRKLKEKKKLIKSVVDEILEIEVPVVLMENDYEEYNLKKRGHYTVLPNGEKQPKNLYHACQQLLERNEDHLGLLVLNSSFTRMRKERPTEGHTIPATDSSSEPLSKDEMEFSNTLSEIAKGDTLRTRAMEYAEKHNFDATQREEVSKLVKCMNQMGLCDDVKSKSVTIEEINDAYREPISENGVEMLRQQFGIKRKGASFNSASVIGQGYNIITDKSVSAQILTFSAVNETKFGCTIPSCAQIVRANDTREYQMDFESNESYMKFRLQNLGLNVDLAQSLSNFAPKIGANTDWKNNSTDQSTKSSKTSLTEYRIAKVNIGNFESEMVSFTNDFKTAVRRLPEQYTGGEEDKQKFEGFFDRFGHFVITSAYIGGAVEVTTHSKIIERSKDDDDSTDGSAGASVPGVVNINVSGKDQISTKNAKNAVLNVTQTQWQGGRSDLHTKSTIECEEKMRSWKASLSEEPTLLTNEMSLHPVYSMVTLIDESKGNICRQAFRDLFHYNDLYPTRNRQDQNALEARKEMQKSEQEQRRIENADFRKDSTRDPDSKGWFSNNKSQVIAAGGALVVFAGGVILTFLSKK